MLSIIRPCWAISSASDLEGHGALGGRAEALVVPVDGDAIVVPGDGPEPGTAGFVLPVDGVVTAQMRQPGVGDTGHVGPGIREVDGGDIRQGAHEVTRSSDNRTRCPILRMVSPGRLEVNASPGSPTPRSARRGSNDVPQWTVIEARRGELTASRVASRRNGNAGSYDYSGGGSTAAAGMMATDFVGSSGSRMTCRR